MKFTHEYIRLTRFTHPVHAYISTLRCIFKSFHIGLPICGQTKVSSSKTNQNAANKCINKMWQLSLILYNSTTFIKSDFSDDLSGPVKTDEPQEWVDVNIETWEKFQQSTQKIVFHNFRNSTPRQCHKPLKNLYVESSTKLTFFVQLLCWLNKNAYFE